jgi:hypothetical protein
MKLICILLGFAAFVFSQKVQAQSLQHYLRFADKAFQEKDYVGASYYYQEALAFAPRDLSIQTKLAEALRLSNQYAEAERMYKKVYENPDRSDFPEALFWLAMMQKMNANYVDAKKSFDRFSKYYNNRNSYYYKKSVQEIKACAFAVNALRDTLQVPVIQLESPINSTASDFAPLLLSDDTLLFTSSRNILTEREKAKLYLAYKSDTDIVVKYLDSNLNNSAYHIANGHFDKARKNFYYTYCEDDNAACKIYKADFNGKNFTNAEALPDPINIEGYHSTQAFPFEHNNKEYLVFASDRPQGRGGYDLWFSVLSRGKYNTARNLGARINTPDDELTPFYHADSATLFFSSSWHEGFGGSDIFMARGDISSLGMPKNMGWPINSAVNDLYFTVNDEYTKAHFSSNRESSFKTHGTEYCCSDIFKVDLQIPQTIEDSIALVAQETPVTKDSILPEKPLIQIETLEEINAYLPILYFPNDVPNPRTWDTITSLSYGEIVNGYLSLKETYIAEYTKGIEGELYRKSLEEMNGFFDKQIVEGLAELELFCSLLLSQLEKGLKIKLTIKGYASPLARSDYNKNLTYRRIYSFVNFLEEYKEGVFTPYLKNTATNGGNIIIEKIPYGDVKADQSVSANINDKRNSVYSLKAALERRIEVISVKEE